MNEKNPQELMDRMQSDYDSFRERNGYSPVNAVCGIRYKDDNNYLEVTFELTSGSEDEEDDDIFFYCNSLEGLKSLTDPEGCEDFYITEFFYFC